MNQEVTITNSKLLIKDGACSLEVERQGELVTLQIISDVQDGFFAIDHETAHIISLFLKLK